MEKNKFRTFKEAVLQVIKDSGGEINLQSIYDKITDYWKFSPYQMEFAPKWGSERYKHDVRGALYGLKRNGLIDNPIRGMWALIDKVPTLRKKVNIYRQKKSNITKYAEDRLFASLKNEVQKIRSFLNGTLNSLPETGKLCFWVWLCYNFSLYSEGAMIYRKIDGSSVSPDLYRITQKIGLICESKVEE